MSSSQNIVKVAIVEDDFDIRMLMAGIIDAHPLLFLGGAFESGEKFLQKIPRLDIDVVLMDIGLPGISGIECVANAKGIRPDMQFLMTTVFDNPQNIFDSLCAGATGYIIKTDPPHDITKSIIEMNNGGVPMSRSIARLVVNHFSHSASMKVKDDELLQTLTAREREVLEMLAVGLLYKEIATRMFVSPETVRSHIKHIYEKLQVRGKVEAINKLKWKT